MDHLGALSVLTGLHALTTTYIRDAPKLQHTRWCALHAMGNALITWTAASALWVTPVRALRPGWERFPVTFAIQMHAYHALAYPLSPDDRMHHLVFAFVLGVPSYVYSTTATAAMLVFLSGLPGGLIYALVALRRCGRLAWVPEPRFSAAVNLGLRAPGILWVTARVLLIEPRIVPLWVWWMQLVLPVINAVYYGHQSAVRAWATRA